MATSRQTGRRSHQPESPAVLVERRAGARPTRAAGWSCCPLEAKKPMKRAFRRPSGSRMGGPTKRPRDRTNGPGAWPT